MFYVYILQSLKYPKQIYIGFANDLKIRLMKHNNGEVFSTKRYMPWKLIYYEAYTSEKLARGREKQLKHHGNAIKYLKKRIFEEPISKNGAWVNQKGQTLVSLMIFMVTAIIIITAAVAVIIINSKATSKFYQGIVSYDLAEVGIENAIIRLLRNPSYTGETLVLEDKTVEIQVSGAGTGSYTIISSGTNGNFKRTIQATASYNDNILNISSWEEQ